MIGTLTVHFNSNYGANLQAYALRRFLQTRTREKVRVIDYRNDRIRNLYAFRPWNVHSHWPFFSMSLESIKRFVKICLNPKGTLVRDAKFAAFRKNHLPTTRLVHDTEDIKKLGCSLIVVGSDQIWNEAITGDREKAFWGAMKTDRNFVACYAPSFGRSAITEEERLNIAEHLGDFDYLTVREPSMVAMLEPFARTPIHVVCDPVFLLERSEWLQLASPGKGKCLVVYLVERNPLLLEMAKVVADALSLEMVVLSTGQPFRPLCGRDLKTDDPADFLAWMSQAEFIVTNSFHGTAFSVLFNKPFLTLPDTKKSARMVEFLDRCHLSDRICHTLEAAQEIVRRPICFDDSNAAIAKMKQESMACIDEILRLSREDRP